MTLTLEDRHGRPSSGGSLLSVRDLSVEFVRRGKAGFQAVDGVSFDVSPGQTVGLVGESGCGKSVTSLAVMGLLPKRGVRVSGEVRFDGQSLLELDDRARRNLRGSEMAMVFQDPMTSLNPVVPIGTQVSEVLRRHEGASASEARDEAEHLLRRVGIPDPTRRLREYPHQLSGGMRQRALIAIALACKPRLLIADEPTTALDVTIQAQILELLGELVRESGTALVMITHDLGVVAGLCDVVNVMYAGRVVESASRHELFARPRHRYTAGLLSTIPRLDQPRDQPLVPIPGSANDRVPWSRGCAFLPRCPAAVSGCSTPDLPLAPDGSRPGHAVRCVNPVPEGLGRSGDWATAGVPGAGHETVPPGGLAPGDEEDTDLALEHETSRTWADAASGTEAADMLRDVERAESRDVHGPRGDAGGAARRQDEHGADDGRTA